MEPFFDDDGDQIGWATEAADGAIIGVSLDGTEIIGAIAADGTTLDPSGYEFASNDTDPYDGDLEKRLHHLEQMAADNEGYLMNAAAQFQRDLAADVDQERMAADVENGVTSVEKQ